jgi:hypothetical protein
VRTASGKVAGTSPAGAPAFRGFVALDAPGGTQAFGLHGAEVGVVSAPVGFAPAGVTERYSAVES